VPWSPLRELYNAPQTPSGPEEGKDEVGERKGGKKDGGAWKPGRGRLLH